MASAHYLFFGIMESGLKRLLCGGCPVYRGAQVSSQSVPRATGWTACLLLDLSGALGPGAHE